LTLPVTIAKPIRAVGGFFALALDTIVQMFKPPFAFREFLLQTWFIARVSILPTLMLSIPFTVLAVFILNILLVEFGAADFSGSGAALGAITQIGPVVTVLVVAGAGATAMCADLGARTIREELDAMEVMGVSPIQRLVVPRVLAVTGVALFLNGLVSVVGVLGGYFLNIYVQHGTAGSYLSSFSTLAQLPDLYVSELKALIFGFLAGIIAAYRGLNPRPGPKGVGDAVNESVVIAFVMLFVVNVVLTAIYLRVVPAKVA
jgi:phospholipid/cholesterol/gamma-HCH transport system permease protein